MSNLAGKVIVVTGASEGIGRTLCTELAPLGPKLVLAARNEERLKSVAAECESAGAQTLIVQTDVTEESQCARLMEKTVEAFGSLDVLVNNAGGTMWAQFEEVEDLAIYGDLMKLNYLSAVYCTRYALPHLKSTRGLLVGVSSLAGMLGVPSRTGYAASKHAMFGFFDSLRIELQGTGVDVTMIAPDFVVSEIHKRAIKGDGTPMSVTPMQESKIMDAKTCAGHIIRGMERRGRLVIMTRRGHLGRWLKLLAPKVIDNIAKRAIESGK